MSFSKNLKNELARELPESKDLKKAELNAFVRFNSQIEVDYNDKLTLTFITENAAIGRRVFSLIKSVYNFLPKLHERKNNKKNVLNSYYITLSKQEALTVLKDVGFRIDEKNIAMIVGDDFSSYEEDEENRAFLRAAFMASGSITNPENSYHMEFVAGSKEYAKALMELVNSFSLNSKVVKRKKDYIVYLKDSDEIVELLSIIGGHKSLLEFENIRIMKEIRNNTNRIVNCETANLDRIVDTSLRQVRAIELIDEKMGLEKLDDNLRELAYLRLKNRTMSLKELGENLTPPLGKSGVNYRLKKIEELAKTLGE